MTVIYRSDEWIDENSQDYHYTEYQLEDKTVFKYRIRRRLFFNGYEHIETEDKTLLDSWSIEDRNFPDWLANYL